VEAGWHLEGSGGGVGLKLVGDDSFGYLCLLWDKPVYCRKRKRLEVDRTKKRKKNNDK